MFRLKLIGQTPTKVLFQEVQRKYSNETEEYLQKMRGEAQEMASVLKDVDDEVKRMKQISNNLFNDLLYKPEKICARGTLLRARKKNLRLSEIYDSDNKDPTFYDGYFYSIHFRLHRTGLYPHTTL